VKRVHRPLVPCLDCPTQVRAPRLRCDPCEWRFLTVLDHNRLQYAIDRRDERRRQESGHAPD
jgi:hypothetical protein